MQTFIDQLADEVLKKHQSGLKEICIVFPTRRAGLFFKRSLSGKISNPTWSPTIFSIQDFILKSFKKQIPDSLTLIFELFEAYKQFFPTEDFARFYPWGELMLKDFDDIDKYLVDASKVFTTVTDLHQIDQEFALDEEDTERLRLFWKNFFDRDPSLLRNEFMNTWRHLHEIYADFRKNLEAKGIAYEGMAYRDLASNPEAAFKEDNADFSHIIFAGFYALTPAEKAVIEFLVNSGKANMYWDADVYYTDDPAQEAGKFFRNNTLTGNSFFWKQEHFKTIKKEIEFAAVPLMVGQAKYAGNLLSSLMKEQGFQSEKTAVVLPDEKLLFPVLYSLPEDLEHVNVTMGYPLKQSPLYNLFESLMNLQRNSRLEKEGEVTFFFRDVLNVINHPYLRLIADKQIRAWLSKLEQNFIRIPGAMLANKNGPEIFRILFTELADVKSIFEWLKNILRLILHVIKEQDFRFHRIESEFIYHFYTNLRRLEDILKDNTIVDDIEMFWRIFREIISTVKIPFTGEPLQGLQVMGFLETRVLDFDNVIILSVNEDVLPSGGNSPSFIPFNIRKAFGLPTFEEQHAVSAFHFYRLLQRAKRIYLIHNSESKALTSGERSRFMLQIEHELLTKYPDAIHITKKVISTRAISNKAEPISIKKTPAVLKELQRFVASGANHPSNALSASGLMSYINCSLRFYFHYVAGLRELEETEENMEAATFGKVLHKAMYLLYKDVRVIDEKSLSKVKEKINDCIDEAIHQEFVSINQLEGKNILLRNIIHELIVRILESERKYMPVNLMQLEKDVSNLFTFDNDKTVKLYGIIDRVDEKNEILRIVDYKTGRVIEKNPDSMDDLFKDPAYKEQFQATYYAYLTDKLIPGKQIKSGLLVMRDMREGVKLLNNEEVFTEERFKQFELLLATLLKEIFSEEFTFSQTEDISRCEYCPFISICNR